MRDDDSLCKQIAGRTGFRTLQLGTTRGICARVWLFRFGGLFGGDQAVKADAGLFFDTFVLGVGQDFLDQLELLRIECRGNHSLLAVRPDDRGREHCDRSWMLKRANDVFANLLLGILDRRHELLDLTLVDRASDLRRHLGTRGIGGRLLVHRV